MHIATGTIVDNRYRLTGSLGEGGMGAVYSAVEVGINRQVALKIIRSGLASDHFRQRFKQEANALSRLSHKNIVQVYRYGVWKDQTAYVAMELLEGTTLRDLLSRKTLLSPQQALEIAIQVADALEAAHRADIIHRDIKPPNIFITNVNEVKLIDFGLCKLLFQSGAEFQSLTQSGALVGSVHYMSPEACLGKSAEKRSDVYSLGIVIFEMMTGQPPFDFENAIGLLHMQANAAIPSLRERYPLVAWAADFDRFFARCLAKNPGDRFADMSELKAAIKGLQTAIPETSKTSTLADPRVFRRDSSRRLWITGLGAIFISISAGAYLHPEFGSKLIEAPCFFLSASSRLSYLNGASQAAERFNCKDLSRLLLSDARDAAQIANDYLTAAEISAQLSSIAFSEGKKVDGRIEATSALRLLAKVSAPVNDPPRYGTAIAKVADLLRIQPLHRGANNLDSVDLAVDAIRKTCQTQGLIGLPLPLLALNADTLATTSRPGTYLFDALKSMAEEFAACGKSKQAADYYGRALKEFESLSPEAQSVELCIVLSSGLGQSLIEQHQFKAAQPYLELSVRRFEQLSQARTEVCSPRLIDSLGGLGNCFAADRKFQSALRCYDRAIAAAERFHQQEYFGICKVYVSKGKLYASVGRLADARASLAFAKAFVIRKKYLDDGATLKWVDDAQGLARDAASKTHVFELKDYH